MEQRKRRGKVYSEPLPYWTRFVVVDSSRFSFCAVTVPVWISDCNQCFYSSTFKIHCFSQGKANPRTSACQSLRKFIVSLCALFLNMGSNIHWKPSMFKCRQWLFTHWPQMLHKCLGTVAGVQELDRDARIWKLMSKYHWQRSAGERQWKQ